MSLLSTRQAFATALSTVTGVTGFVDPPSIMSPGGAWPLLASMDAAGPAGLFVSNWRVLVVTGSTPENALTFLDTNLAAIVDALAPIAYIQTVTPVTIPMDSAGPLYGVELTTVRE
jgi:hypothetical protein